MGGGAFRFFGINIYQVSLYINTDRAAASPLLRDFVGQDMAALQKNESFYRAMMSGEVREGGREGGKGLEGREEGGWKGRKGGR
jgi:hypothetical protein